MDNYTLGNGYDFAEDQAWWSWRWLPWKTCWPDDPLFANLAPSGIYLAHNCKSLEFKLSDDKKNYLAPSGVHLAHNHKSFTWILQIARWYNFLPLQIYLPVVFTLHTITNQSHQSYNWIKIGIYAWKLQTFGEHELISFSFNCYCPFGGILNFISISFSGSITFNIAITFIITKFLTNLMFLINFFQNSNIGIYSKIANFYNKIMFFIN